MGTSIGMIERHYSHLTPRLKKDMLTGRRMSDGMVSRGSPLPGVYNTPGYERKGGGPSDLFPSD